MTEHTHFRTCHLCEAMCGIAVEVEGERILAIRGDKDDPFSRGHICPKAVALKDVHEDPDRLRRPLRRTAGGWVEVGWDEALDEAAERLAAVQKAHGRNAVAIYQGNPVVHNHGSVLFSQLLLKSLGSRSRSEEHTSELQSRRDLVCRLLLEKKKKKIIFLFLLNKKKNKIKKY